MESAIEKAQRLIAQKQAEKERDREYFRNRLMQQRVDYYNKQQRIKEVRNQYMQQRDRERHAVDSRQHELLAAERRRREQSQEASATRGTRDRGEIEAIRKAQQLSQRGKQIECDQTGLEDLRDPNEFVRSRVAKARAAEYASQKEVHELVGDQIEAQRAALREFERQQTGGAIYAHQQAPKSPSPVTQRSAAAAPQVPTNRPSSAAQTTLTPTGNPNQFTVVADVHHDINYRKGNRQAATPAPAPVYAQREDTYQSGYDSGGWGSDFDGTDDEEPYYSTGGAAAVKYRPMSSHSNAAGGAALYQNVKDPAYILRNPTAGAIRKSRVAEPADGRYTHMTGGRESVGSYKNYREGVYIQQNPAYGPGSSMSGYSQKPPAVDPYQDDEHIYDTADNLPNHPMGTSARQPRVHGKLANEPIYDSIPDSHVYDSVPDEHVYDSVPDGRGIDNLRPISPRQRLAKRENPSQKWSSSRPREADPLENRLRDVETRQRIEEEQRRQEQRRIAEDENRARRDAEMRKEQERRERASFPRPVYGQKPPAPNQQTTSLGPRKLDDGWI